MQVKGTFEIHRHQGILEEEVALAVRVVGEAGELILGTPGHLQPSVPIPAALEAQLVLHLPREVIQGQRQGFIVVNVLIGAVAQHVAARHPRPAPILRELVILDAQGIVPLPVHLKGVEDGHLVEVIFGRSVVGRREVELEIVVGPNAEDRPPLIGRRLMHPLELHIIVDGQEGQAEDLKEELEVAATRTQDEGAVLPRGPFKGQAEVARAHDGIGCPLIGPGCLEAELHDTGQRVAPGGGESPGIELDFLHEVHVDHAHRSPTRPLGLEVVDVRDLDAVDVEAVLVGRPAADHDVVSETGDGRHPGQAADGLADVPTAPRVALDLVGPNAPQGHRSLLLSFGGGRDHFRGFDGNGQGRQRHREESRARRRQLDFQPVGRLVPD